MGSDDSVLLSVVEEEYCICSNVVRWSLDKKGRARGQILVLEGVVGRYLDLSGGCVRIVVVVVFLLVVVVIVDTLFQIGFQFQRGFFGVFMMDYGGLIGGMQNHNQHVIVVGSAVWKLSLEGILCHRTGRTRNGMKGRIGFVMDQIFQRPSPQWP